MTKDPSATPQPNDPANPPPRVGADEFAATIHSFWEKNRGFILLLCLAVFAVILAREGWDYYRAMRERGVQAAYARIDKVEQLPKFATDNAGHALAGVAWLRVADDAYGRKDFRAAAGHYEKAAAGLENALLVTRARLGAAMSLLAAGDAAAGEAALKAISSDASAAAALRAEATYHLATLARDSGRTDEALRLAGEIGKIDATGLWAQRAFMLRTQIESAKPAAPAAQDTGIQFKTGG